MTSSIASTIPMQKIVTKWSLSINPSKFQYILFSLGKIVHFNIEFSTEKKTATNKLKFLEMHIDRAMNFLECIDAIKVKFIESPTN